MIKIAGSKPKAVAKKAGTARKAAAPSRPSRPSRYDDDDDDDDDDDAPPRRRRSADKKGAALPDEAIMTGWSGADAQSAKGSGFTNNLSIESGSFAVVRFLDDSPYASQRVHWLKREGRRSFICAGKDCPLCAGGSDHRLEVRFSVALLTEDLPLLKSLNAGKSLSDQIKDFANSRSGPLTRSGRFYLYTKKGAGMRTRHKIEMVRRSEVESDYAELYIPTPEELEDLGTYSRDDVVNETTMSELQDVADEYFSGGYNGDDDDE